jgi:hypothetical protein
MTLSLPLFERESIMPTSLAGKGKGKGKGKGERQCARRAQGSGRAVPGIFRSIG